MLTSMLRTRTQLTTMSSMTRGLNKQVRAMSSAPADDNIQVYQEFPATMRSEEGSRQSRRLRKQGWTPGLLYGPDMEGKDARKAIQFETRLLKKEMRRLGGSLENTVFNLAIDGDEPVAAIPRDLQLHPVSDEPVSVNFIRFIPGRQVSFPVEFLNTDSSPGLKRGGYINYIRREIKCVCETTTLPKTLQLDVQGLHVGAHLPIEAVQFPEGITPVVIPGRENQLVATIAGKRGLVRAAGEEDDEEDAE